MNIMLRFSLLALAAALLAACASYDGRGLQAGASADQVRAVMGEPAETFREADGGTTLEYPRGPYGRDTYMVRIGPDGRLRSIQQVLTEENFARIVIGKSTRDDVRHLIGRPNSETFYPLPNERVWLYRYRSGGEILQLLVGFNPAGVVINVAEILDPSRAPNE